MPLQDSKAVTKNLRITIEPTTNKIELVDAITDSIIVDQTLTYVYLPVYGAPKTKLDKLNAYNIYYNDNFKEMSSARNVPLCALVAMQRVEKSIKEDHAPFSIPGLQTTLDFDFSRRGFTTLEYTDYNYSNIEMPTAFISAYDAPNNLQMTVEVRMNGTVTIRPYTTLEETLNTIEKEYDLLQTDSFGKLVFLSTAELYACQFNKSDGYFYTELSDADVFENIPGLTKAILKMQKKLGYPKYKNALDKLQ